jgi:hypothetical protein
MDVLLRLRLTFDEAILSSIASHWTFLQLLAVCRRPPADRHDAQSTLRRTIVKASNQAVSRRDF